MVFRIDLGSTFIDSECGVGIARTTETTGEVDIGVGKEGINLDRFSITLCGLSILVLEVM
jgi:hypothetical protein